MSAIRSETNVQLTMRTKTEHTRGLAWFRELTTRLRLMDFVRAELDRCRAGLFHLEAAKRPR